MQSFRNENLQNIKSVFTEKTGVRLPRKAPRRVLKTALIAAAILTLCFTVTAFAAEIFSMNDALALSSRYEGDGIVSITVENRSDKDLILQPQLKLMLWSTGEEISPLSSAPLLQETAISPHTERTITLDLSSAYDVAALEEPLTNDHYYFLLTNNHFLFGHDWMCSVDFAENIYTPPVYPDAAAPVDVNVALKEEIEAQLLPFFDCGDLDMMERRDNAKAYFEVCQELFSALDGNVVSPVSPLIMVDDAPSDVIFDETVPAENQRQLTSLHHYVLDGYNLPVGASEDESALVIGTFVPRHKGDTDGGADIPLIYIFTYEKEDITSPEDLTLIHGQLVTFAELEAHKVFEDDTYVCYNATDLFYTDLANHVEGILSGRTDVYYDAEIEARMESVHRYYSDPDVLRDSLHIQD